MSGRRCFEKANSAGFARTCRATPAISPVGFTFMAFKQSAHARASAINDTGAPTARYSRARSRRRYFIFLGQRGAQVSRGDAAAAYGQAPMTSRDASLQQFPRFCRSASVTISTKRNRSIFAAAARRDRSTRRRTPAAMNTMPLTHRDDCALAAMPFSAAPSAFAFPRTYYARRERPFRLAVRGPLKLSL